MKDLEEKIKGLKAEAYDALALIEQARARLNELNNEIANISFQIQNNPQNGTENIR